MCDDDGFTLLLIFNRAGSTGNVDKDGSFIATEGGVGKSDGMTLRLWLLLLLLVLFDGFIS